MLAHNGQDRRRAGIHCPAALNLYRVQRLTKDITVQINKQGPVPIAIGIRPARMKPDSDEMTTAPTSSQPCSKPNDIGSFIRPGHINKRENCLFQKIMSVDCRR